MPYEWSTHARHAVSIFRPWREGDGYTHPELLEIERSLGVQIPRMLRSFYKSWGRRGEITRAREELFSPGGLTLEKGMLRFAGENQFCFCCAIPYELLDQENPPVYFTCDTHDLPNAQWELGHKRLSDFLDYLVYGHAICCGSPFGGHIGGPNIEALAQRIPQRWPCIELASAPMGLYPIPDYTWKLFGEDGLVITRVDGLWVAARTPELLEKVRQQLQIEWEETWGPK